MNEIIENENIVIENMIYEIRGVQVMVDYDLAKLYQCTNGTKDINKAVKRNINRFPDDFYFQLTENEKKQLWFQSGTANNMSRTNPHVFTEQGIAMLSSVLHTDVAEKIIIDNYAGKELLNILKKIDKRIVIVFKNIDETLNKKYKSQYNNISFISNNSFHERFIILDRSKLYSCGVSFKDLGKKCFAISEFDDKEYLIRLLEIINL